MKVELWVIGKTNEAYLAKGMAVYEKRLGHYLRFNLLVIPEPKKIKTNNPELIKTAQSEIVLQKLKPDDWLVLLDEKGRQFTSVEFAGFMEKQLGRSQKRLIFLVGGAFGFSPELYARANDKMALSKMTFSHQMIRLFFLEQLYRAMTILKNEKYHNA